MRGERKFMQEQTFPPGEVDSMPARWHDAMAAQIQNPLIALHRGRNPAAYTFEHGADFIGPGRFGEKDIGARFVSQLAVNAAHPPCQDHHPQTGIGTLYTLDDVNTVFMG